MHLTLHVPAHFEKDRADKICLTLLVQVTRSQLKIWFDEGYITRKGKTLKPSQMLSAGDTLEVITPPPRPQNIVAEDLPLNIVYEDDTLMAINKPAGLVVHPAAGHASGTLANALVYYLGRQSEHSRAETFRAGLVHRIDKDTTGLLVVAKTEETQNELQKLFKTRALYKEYFAIVWGRPSPGKASLKNSIGRHPTHRKKFTSKFFNGRAAHTDYEVLQTVGPVSFVKCIIHTGRTHQIRVHLADAGHPLVGDMTYGRKHPTPKEFSFLNAFPRQALHAQVLEFVHPKTAQKLRLEAPLPEDLSLLKTRLLATKVSLKGN